MKYKILILDLDGTLVNSQKKITDETKAALIEYQEKGGTVILASGRPVYGIIPLADELKLHKYGGYIIAFNGGTIIECSSMKSIWEKWMPGKSITFLYKFAMEHEIGIVTYEDENIITETPENEYVLEEQKINKMTIKKVDSFCDYVKFPVTKCLMVGDGDILENIETKLKEEVGQMLSICRSAPYFLEIMPLNITKDGALSWLSKCLKVDRTCMAACGDGYNDQSMLEYAGLGVAMGNAQECVKEIAQIVAPDNDHEGVAWVVHKLLNEK